MDKKISLQEICVTAIFTALTAIMAQISIPIPISPVPITLQLFAIYLSSIILGKKLGTLSQVIYVILGAIGIPVFANFSGGLQSVMGPSGGFIISFPIIAWIMGYFFEKTDQTIYKVLISVGSLFVCYGIGTIQLAFVLNLSIQKAIAIGVLPYIPLDIFKIVIAYTVGNKVRSGLLKAGYLRCSY